VNNLTGSKDLLAQLDTFKTAVQDFAAREETLHATFRAQAGREKDAFDTTDHQQTASASERMGDAMDAVESGKTWLQDWFTGRNSRINAAHGRLHEQLLSAAKSQENECRFKAQQELTAAEQHRETALAQSAAKLEHFQRRLDESTVAFNELEKSVRSAFGGYGRFRRWLNAPGTQPDFPGDAQAMLDEFQRISEKIRADLGRFKKFPLPKIFKFIPFGIVAGILLGLAVLHPVLVHFNRPDFFTFQTAIALAALVVVLVVYLAGGRAAATLAKVIAGDFVRLRQLLETGSEKSAAAHQLALEQIEQQFQDAKTGINQEWKQATREIIQSGQQRQAELENRAAQLQSETGRLYQVKLRLLQESHDETMQQLRLESGTRAEDLAKARRSHLAKLEADFQAGLQTLAAEWQDRALPLLQTLQSAGESAQKLFPDWQTMNGDGWTPPGDFLNAVKFGRLELDLEKFIGTLPRDSRLALPGPKKISLPLLLTQPQQGSLLFETGKTGGDDAVGSINSLILRLLATTPPGRLEFTVFDPVGLGQNFAALMHLADYEASTINSRIWTQTAQFEEKLAELNEHMEKIIQMYLRNEYATITEYNAQAGSIAEKYHFLVIASFPANFSDVAAKRLRNIAANGARCGVFTLIQWDQRSPMPPEFVPDELRKNSICLARTENGFELSGWRVAGTKVILDELPSPEFTTQLLHRIGDAGKGSNRVEVPFEQITPAAADFWTDETSVELRVPIGRSGATKLQYLAVGRDTRQHALIAGKTGSGKSTLFHIIITNLALRCSPEQVEFYLVDFKKGVEFKCYANHRLPHAKVVAIESDRAFGLSVLQRVDDELRRRGDLFRKVGAQDLAGYKRSVAATPSSQKSQTKPGDEGVAATEPMPRVLMMIDEFQEFFTEEDRISQNAAVLLDRIVRQGRAFGIHVILGSQTLGGAYTLARATIGQMVIRIALQCNEADAYLIMDQDNPAPRLLSRPGEGIYNDTAGSIEGNSPFQAVWLSDRVREDYLAKIRALADKSGREYPGPIVFEGNAPADVRENLPLRAVLKNAGKISTPPRIWLGAPNSIKGPTEVVFRRQSASHLLVVGQSDDRVLTILSVALVSLAAQHAKDGAKFFVLHNLAAENAQLDFFQRVISSIPQPVIQAGNANVSEVMATLAEELKRRQENEAPGPEIFVLIHDLQNFKKLRQEDEFSFSSSSTEATPAAALLELITNGPAHGIHVILACDSYGNVNRFLGRKTLGEIEMRVAFQMSAGDSASLIDAPDASALGLHRAVLLNDREGSLETFRPYALPENDWLEEVGKSLATK
jgi:DNA segregation ATPase FtsK/SpoIIIE, S-DNA-T family